MTKQEIRTILRSKTIYVQDNGTNAVSRFKFYVKKRQGLVDITRDLANFGEEKLTANGEIKESVQGMDRVFNVLYHIYYKIRGRDKSHRGHFNYIFL